MGDLDVEENNFFKTKHFIFSISTYMSLIFFLNNNNFFFSQKIGFGTKLSFCIVGGESQKIDIN